MPATPDLRIETPSGTERATLSGLTAERDRYIVEPARAEITVDRDEWQAVVDSINERADRFRIDAEGVTGWFGGRFRDTERGTHTVTVMLDSYERDAQDAEPTGGQKLYQNVDDATIVSDALSRVPTLSPGTIQTVASGLSFSFANASAAKQIRDVAEAGGALVRYNADRTVDFLNRSTADGTEPELSPSAGTLIGDPDISDDNRNPPTDIIGLGAQSGPNQVRATATVVAGADRRVYRRYENKDIQTQSRLQTIVDRLATEIGAAGPKLDIEAEAVGIDLSPGDLVDVLWPEQDLSDTLRTIETSRVIDADGARYAAVRAANRWPEQGGAQKAREDLERFRSGYQGFIDRDNFSIDNQPVSASLNAEDSYFYPSDVVDEKRAEIRVRGRAYRSFVASAGHTHDIQIGTTTSLNDAVDVNDSAQLTLTLTNGTSSWSDGATFTENATVPSSWEGYPIFVVLRVTGAAPTDTNAPVAGDAVSFSFDSSSLLTAGIQSSEHHQFTPSDVAFGDNLDIRAYRTATDITPGQNFGAFLRNISGTTLNIDAAEVTLVNMRHNHTIDIGTETSESAAGFEPGVQEFNLYPSNVDVLVNGQSVGVSLGGGSGPFASTVDIAGLLGPGDNQIEFTSDTTGRVTGAVRTELFRQGPEQQL
jgi:hypothetical protein